MSDYHVHIHDHWPNPPRIAPGSFDRVEIERYVTNILEKGEETVCFTEHLYRCVESTPILGEFWLGPNQELSANSKEFVTNDRNMSIERYVEAVVQAKDDGLPVLLGMEVDYFPDSAGAVADFLSPYPWDVLIGTPHWLGEWLVDDPRSAFEFERRGIRESFEQYFDLVAQLANSGLVDVIAHADLIKALGYFPAEEPVDLYGLVVEAAASSGVAMEINTKGLHLPYGEMCPAPTLLQMAHGAGVEITLASDAHDPSDVADNFDKARALARSVGYDSRLEFTGRVARSVPL